MPIFRVYPLGITYAITSAVFFFAAFILTEYRFSSYIYPGNGKIPFYYKSKYQLAYLPSGAGYFPYQYEGPFEISAWILFKALIVGVGNIFFIYDFVP